jgi:hypothetical protein
MSVIRSPQTHNERKATVHHITEARIEDYPIKVRPRYLPTNWDDIMLPVVKCWKDCGRENQYKSIN